MIDPLIVVTDLLMKDPMIMVTEPLIDRVINIDCDDRSADERFIDCGGVRSVD